jgi:hypothetical protein
VRSIFTGSIKVFLGSTAVWRGVVSLGTAVLLSMPVAARDRLETQVVPPISARMVLPDTPVRQDEPRSRLFFQAARGEFEPASFVIRLSAAKPEVISLEVTDLRDLTSGRVIKSTALDIRIVKPWFQSYYAWNEIGKSAPDDFRQRLVPELLLKDDALVQVDLVAGTNRVRVTEGGSTRYRVININSNSTTEDVASTITDFPIEDAAVLQPIRLLPEEVKQVWLTIHVPGDAVAGRYEGRLSIRGADWVRAFFDVQLDVLDFDLAASQIKYGIYYRGSLGRVSGGVSSEFKTEQQVVSELRNMRSHGILHPTLYQPLSNEVLLRKELSLRKKEGMANGPLYYAGIQTYPPLVGANFGETEEELRRAVVTAGKLARSAGYSALFVYGVDEARGDKLVQQRRLWKVVHSTGAKVFVAGYSGAHRLVGDLLDTLVHAYQPSLDESRLWHANGKEIFSYANPQTGPENPYLFRFNYGLLLWANAYDGAMPYAYQHCFGSCWNDVDHPVYRDHNLTYPTESGVIDTLAWEGLREGIDDVRYLHTLEALLVGTQSDNSVVHRAQAYLVELQREIRQKQGRSGKYNQRLTLDLDAIRKTTISHIMAVRAVSGGAAREASVGVN